MKKKSLLQPNTYLKDLQKREELLVRTVMSSSRIEGIHIPVETILRSENKPDSKPVKSK